MAQAILRSSLRSVAERELFVPPGVKPGDGVKRSLHCFVGRRFAWRTSLLGVRNFGAARARHQFKS